MRSFLMSLLLLCSTIAFSQATTTAIKDYTDERLPSELVTLIKQLSVDDFDAFKEKGVESKDYKGILAKFKYKVKYVNGFITGKVNVIGIDTDVSFDIELPFRYCCGNHNPSHCSRRSEEIIKNQKDNGCSGWKRVEVE